MRLGETKDEEIEEWETIKHIFTASDRLLIERMIFGMDLSLNKALFVNLMKDGMVKMDVEKARDWIASKGVV